MDSAEKKALQTLQMELFETRANLAHESECIARALRTLDTNKMISISASNMDPETKILRLADAIDIARRELLEERKR